MKMTQPNTLSPEEQETLLNTLEARFSQHPTRHAGLEWAAVRARLAAAPGKLWSLQEMERTGGEPDVVGQDAATGEYLFYDCAAETPTGRRSLCYDRAGLDARKEHKPAHNAVELAADMGITLLTEAEYRALQQVGPFDSKTSSWLHTPDEIRQLGGALYADFRYGRTFVYHNGAQSYYGGRGFRGVLRV